MNLFGKEHYELMAAFERSIFWVRYKKEPKELWRAGRIYKCRETNNLFKAFRLGYALGKKEGDAA